MTVFREPEPADTVLLISGPREGGGSVLDRRPQVLLAVRDLDDLLGEFATIDGRTRSASVRAITDIGSGSFRPTR